MQCHTTQWDVKCCTACCQWATTELSSVTVELNKLLSFFYQMWIVVARLYWNESKKLLILNAQTLLFWKYNYNQVNGMWGFLLTIIQCWCQQLMLKTETKIQYCAMSNTLTLCREWLSATTTPKMTLISAKMTEKQQLFERFVWYGRHPKIGWLQQRITCRGTSINYFLHMLCKSIHWLTMHVANRQIVNN